MHRPWLKSYPPGLPADIDPDAYRSVVEVIDAGLARHADKEFAVCLGRAMRFAELDRKSRDFAAWLQSRGVAPGARVALMLPNVLQFPVAMVGVLRAGGVVVAANPLYTARELGHQLRDSGAEVLVVLENFAHVAQQALEGSAVRHVAITSIGELLGFPRGAIVDHVVRRVRKLVPAYALPDAVRFGAALAEGRRHALRPAPRAPEDLAFLQYTGGTTGVSKGAMLTHRNVVAAMLQVDAGVQAALASRRPGAQLNVVAALPLYHIYGLAALLLPALLGGNLLTLIPNPRDIPAFVKALAQRPFHVLPGLNTLFVALLHNAHFRRLDFSSLMFTVAGGMATMPAVAREWQQVTGSVVQEGWGLSETGAIATSSPSTIAEHTGMIGIPSPSVEVVVRDEQNRDVPPGEPGELCVRGPNVMVGYWNRPDETARALTEDGFLRTGDIGTMDENGWFRIVDRKKDMINVSGFNVFPNEIEAVVSNHPGVLECAAVGVPDEHSGEAVKLFVVRRDAALDEDALRAWCHAQLTGYKRPKAIEFTDELPKTVVGKVLRRALRAR